MTTGYLINFLYPAGLNSSYLLPVVKDACAIPYENIVGVMSTPSLKGGSRLSYIFNQREMKECLCKMKTKTINI